MKRRRTLIVSLLLVTALCMGIGYAAVSGTATINGSAALEAQAVNLTITAYNKTDGSTGANGSIGAPGNVVEFSVEGLSQEDNYVTGTFTIKNNNTYPVQLTNAAITYADTQVEGYLNVTCIDENDAELNASTVVIAPNGTTEVEVTVTLEKDYIGDILESVNNAANEAKFTIVITGTATE